MAHVSLILGNYNLPAEAVEIGFINTKGVLHLKQSPFVTHKTYTRKEWERIRDEIEEGFMLFNGTIETFSSPSFCTCINCDCLPVDSECEECGLSVVELN